MNKAGWLICIEVCLLTIFMGIFGLFIHSPFPFTLISFTGFIFVCFIVAFRLVKNAHKPVTFLIAFFGIKPFTRKALLYTVIGLLGGLILGAALRAWKKAPLIPGTMTLFAIGVAPFIGVSEELLFRGYMQRRLYEINGLLAVILAALSHTVYKCSLMLLPPLFDRTKIPVYAILTFIGSLLFGIVSWKSNTVYPALAGHAVFDIIVYSTSGTAPWWVW